MLLKYCAEAGCKAIVQKGTSYCSVHAQRHQQQQQQKKNSWTNATRAGNYHSAQWYALRAKVRKTHPYCAFCGSSQRLEVHHIKSVRLHPELQFEESNLLVLCHTCHAIQTRREIAERRRGGYGKS